MTQHGKVTYHQQVTYCGKPRCRRCREGIGHGPYWYAYQTINGQTTRKYIGKNLPSDVQPCLETTSSITGDSAMALNFSTLSARTTRGAHAFSGADAESVVLRISTLGQFRLECRSQARGKQKNQGWRVIDDASWQQRSVRALLAFLICCPGRRANRSQTIVALWPNEDLAIATSTLNKTLNGLRKVLGHPSVKPGQESHVDVGERFLTDGDWFALAGQESIWVDVDEFDALVRQIEQVGSELPNYGRILQDTIALYSGDFLPEERSSDWAGARRQSLRRKWSNLLLHLSGLHVKSDEYIQAIEVLNTLLGKDPTNELAIQQLIIALMHLKRRGEAIRAYQKFERTLQREYKAVPSAETQALHAAVCAGTDLPELGAFSAIHPSIQSGTNALAFKQPDSGAADNAGPVVPTSSEMVGRTHAGILIGRDKELFIMRSILQKVEQNARLQLVGSRRISGIPLDTQREPQLVFLLGEPGIGKTRLAEELSREAQSNGWNIIWNRIYQLESGTPYRVWIEALRKILHAGPNVLSLLHVETIRALSTLPGLLDVLPAELTEHAAFHVFLPEQAKFTLYTAISDFLKQTSENTPILIVLDDIQWADISSYELLGHLARQLTGHPVVFFATCRDNDVPKDSTHPLRKLILEMQREHTIKTLEIQPLSSEQIKLLVTNLTALPENTVTHIQTYANGNPLFAEQLAHSTPPKLPETISEALEARLQNLKPGCRKLLQHAAVLGRSFELPIICMMETNSPEDMDETVLPLLDEAVDALVLTDEGSGTRIIYNFWHPLLATHLYEQESAVRRARLHQKAAKAIINMNIGREEEVAATVTMHLEKAGAEPLLIAQYAELAGNRAYIVSAYAEAAVDYQKAITYLQQEKSPDGRKSLISLLERLGESMMNSGEYDQARTIFERVLTLYAQDEAHAANVQMQALLWEQMCWAWRFLGNYPRARECWLQGAQILRAANVVGGPVWARLYYTQSNLDQCEGLFDQAQHNALQALAFFEAEQQQRTVVTSLDRKSCKTLMQRIIEGYPDLFGRLQRHLGTIAVSMGQLSLGLAYQNKALTFYEQYDDLRQIGQAASNIGYIHLKKAEYEQANAALRRALRLFEGIGDLPLQSLALSNLGELEASMGHLAEAEGYYQQALKLSMTLRDREYTSRWNADLASILQERGGWQQAIHCIYQAFIVARSIQNSPCIGRALVALGNIRIAQATAEGLVEQTRTRLLAHAQKNLERALRLDVEAEIRMKSQLALAHIALVQGRQQAAETALKQVIVDAQNSEHFQIAAHAKRLLARVWNLRL